MATFNGSIEVNAPISLTYGLFSEFERFPTFMEGIEDVRRIGHDRMYWHAEIAGREEEWEALVTEERQDEKIAWRSVAGATNAGSVTFDKVDANTTRVTLHLEYDPEGFIENVGAALGVVNGRIRGDLNRFKALAESGGRLEADHPAWAGWRGRYPSEPFDPSAYPRDPLATYPSPARPHAVPPLEAVSPTTDPFTPGFTPTPHIAGDVPHADRLAHEDRRLRENEDEDPVGADRVGSGRGSRRA